MLVTNMVKQGFKTAREISESEGESSNKYMDMAYDQLAQHMGETMNLGLAEMIYNNMKDRV
ncbi:MAG: rod-binding protein [Lentisphaerales bacterium]|nr:rod-binding protein [Lentisphaerales bacterium]